MFIFKRLGFIKCKKNDLFNKKFNYSCFSIPYPNQTLKTNFSKTTRQLLKDKSYSDRARLTL